MNCVPEAYTTNYITKVFNVGVENRIKKDPLPHSLSCILGLKKEGGWGPVYQQITGITTEVNTLLPETRLVDRFYPAVAAPPVSHHLNQRLPVSLFSHSHVASNNISIA